MQRATSCFVVVMLSIGFNEIRQARLQHDATPALHLAVGRTKITTTRTLPKVGEADYEGWTGTANYEQLPALGPYYTENDE